MKQVFKIDMNGFYLEPVIVHDDVDLPAELIDIAIPEGFYSPKWTGNQWVEGLSQVEIESLKNQPQPKSELEQLKEQQSLIQQALDDLIFSGGGL